MSALGYNVSDGTEQIVALEAGGEPATLALRRRWSKHGIWLMFQCPGDGEPRPRCAPDPQPAGLDETGIARLLATCAAVRAEAGVEHWPSTRRLRKLALV